MSRKMNVALFISKNTIWRSPSIINLSQVLKTHFNLTVFVANPHNNDVKFLKSEQFSFYRSYSLSKITSIKDIFRILRAIFCNILFGLGIKRINYEKVICFDPPGERFYQKHVSNKNIKRIHYSLELYIPGQGLGASADEEKLPDDAFSDIDWDSIDGLIIQTEERAKCFKEAFCKNDIRTFLLPITSQGPAEKVIKTKYIHERYGIPKDSIILLCLGGLGEGFQIQKMIQYFPKTKKYYLFLHGYELDDIRVEKLKQYTLKEELDNIIFSNEIFTEQAEISRILNSSDIGYLWYEPWCCNTKTAGGSSGKLTSYLKYGLPVVANKQSGSEKYVADRGVGEIVKGHNEIFDKLEIIMKDYTRYSNAAINEYNERYNMDNYIDPLINFIREV